MKKLRIDQLSPQTSNFQTGYLPHSLSVILEPQSEGVETPSLNKYVAISLNSLHRRLLLRCCLPSSPEDVPVVIRCDFRVLQLLQKVDGNASLLTGGRKQNRIDNAGKSELLSEPVYANETSGKEMVWNNRKEKNVEDETCAESKSTSNSGGASAGFHVDEDRMSQEDRQKGALLLRTEMEDVVVGGRYDYHSEIDLARHIAEIEDEGGGGVVLPQMMMEAEKTLSFQQLPSAMRFNDALACTSKDLKILKSGAIKMMRLTVICHSDLHYQNHSEKRHHQNQRHSHSGKSEEQDCCSNETAPKDTTTTLFPKSSSTTVHSSVKVTEDGKCEKMKSGRSADTPLHHDNNTGKKSGNISTKYNIMSSTTTSSHHDSHHEDDNQHRSSLLTVAEEKSKLVKLCSSSTEAGKNWDRLKEKIRSVFQTYDIHVAESTLVNLKSCPVASFHSTFSPSIRFVFVEECEMRNNSLQHHTIGRVTGKTEIIISNVHHISYYERLVDKYSRREEPHRHLYGLENAGKILSSVIEMQGMERRQDKVSHHVSCTHPTGLTEFSHGLLISGPSGCGKTEVVRETAKKVGAHLLSFNPVGSLENASHFCQQLGEIFMSAVVTASRYPTVLLFPRIHLLFQASSAPSSTKSYRGNRERVLHHLCKLFDSIPAGLTLSVVGTTDKAFLVPLQLRRAGRLEREIIIAPPQQSDRLKILQELSRDIPQFGDINMDFVASQTPGYVAQDLVKLLRLCLFKSQEEDCSRVSEEHVRSSIGRVVPSVLEGALGVVDIQRATSLDHIAGLHSVKLDLIKAIVWPLQHPYSFLRMGISPPKGILLYGPPGNCKTTLVRAVAASHHTNFLSVSAAELFSSGVGDSEKIVAHLFHRARMASPCILFIDELESIVGSRQNSEKKQTSTNESILSMLLTEMDGVGVSKIQDARIHGGNSTTGTDKLGNRKETATLGPIVLVVAATNRPDLIDPALLRPGRFDKLIGVPPLDEVGRRELLEICSKSIPFHSDVDFGEIARNTEYYSGADMVNLCREAAMYALSEDMNAPFVTNKHVSMVKCAMGPSLNPAMVRAFHEYGTGV